MCHTRKCSRWGCTVHFQQAKNKELRTALEDEGDGEDKVGALITSKRRLQRGVEGSTEHVATLGREVVQLRNKKLRRYRVEISASHNEAGDSGGSDDDTETYIGRGEGGWVDPLAFRRCAHTYTPRPICYRPLRACLRM